MAGSKALPCKRCGRWFYTTDPQMPCPGCQENAVPVTRQVRLVEVDPDTGEQRVGWPFDGRPIVPARVTACQECAVPLPPEVASYSPISGKLVCGRCLAAGKAQRERRDRKAARAKVQSYLLLWVVSIAAVVGVLYLQWRFR